MSCFRCGKNLPDLQTECEPPCDEYPSDHVSYDPANGPDALVINFCIQPDKKLLKDPEKFAAFQKAMMNFLTAIAVNFKSSGLNEFCKPNTPPQKENE